MSALEEKHRTACDQIIHEAFVVNEAAHYLRKYPKSNGDRKRIGQSVYKITQLLVTLKKIEGSLS